MATLVHPSSAITQPVCSMPQLEKDDTPRARTESIVNLLSSVGHSDDELRHNTSVTIKAKNDIARMMRRECELVTYSKEVNNAKDYVFLGSCSMPVTSDMGITLTDTGHIVLIKGKCHNLLAGWCYKYIIGEKYQYYIFKETKSQHLPKFDNLLIDNDGMLTGKIKGCDAWYTIHMSKVSNFYSSKGVEEKVNVTYIKSNKSGNGQLDFQCNNGDVIKFIYQNNNLYFLDNTKDDVAQNANLLSYKLLPYLKSKHRIISIKRAKNWLQIETVHQQKKRIFYLDPEQIPSSGLSRKLMTHKPPQTLYSFLGGDNHEKYFSGQPFCSKRVGNFSSTHIPLVAPTIDNFRFHLKKAKQAHAWRRKGSMLSHLMKGMDPGFRAVKTSTTHFKKEITNKGEVIKQDVCNKTLRNVADDYSALLREIPDAVITDKVFGCGIARLLQNLRVNDKISLCNESSFSLFFSILQSGIPFNPGWFAGVMFSLFKTHQLSLLKTERGDIRFCFVNKKNISSGVLAGTGQGLETEKIKLRNINFLSVMPFEANIILSACKNKEINFSFEMSEEESQLFLRQKQAPFPLDETTRHYINSAVLKVINDVGAACSIDMKMSEFRSMVGIDSNDGITLLVPRFSANLTHHTEIASIRQRKMQKIGHGEHTHDAVETDTRLRLLTSTTGVASGGKVIISPSLSNNQGKLCFRVSLIEDGESRTVKSKSLLKVPLGIDSGSTHLANVSAHCLEIEKISEILKSIDEKGEVIGTINRLHRVKIVRKMKSDNNIFQRKLMYLLPKTIGLFKKRPISNPHDFENKNNRIKTLKMLKKQLMRKNRASLNKTLNHFFVAKYEITDEYQTKIMALREELALLVANLDAFGEDLSSVKLKQLRRHVIAIKKDTCYRLRAVELKSVGGFSKNKSSLLNVVINIKNRKTISYTRHLGEWVFSYENSNSKTPEIIMGNQSFL